MDFLLIGWISANEEVCPNSRGMEKLAASESNTKGVGHEQDFHTGTPHVRDKCSGNTSKDEQISGGLTLMTINHFHYGTPFSCCSLFYISMTLPCDAIT